ncbi:MAG: DUF1194 domain-containing protein [Rhodobacteraceae bacterium]|nr:DUF1194 domain-containing protein [Paracoccaceae bacterium]
MVKALAAAFAVWAGAAQAACRQALLLALDVSGSVDATEYTLQMRGIASALESADVRNALLALPETPVHLSIFEWSSSSYQREVLDWTPLGDDAAIDAVVVQLRAWRRQVAPEATGIGAAMEHAEARFRDGPVCWQYTLDISGDGRNNDWPLPRELRKNGILRGVTINALAIGPERLDPGDDRGTGIGELTSYFRTQIIQGPGAFVEAAIGYEDYADAMERKLLKELTVLTLGQAKPFDERLIDVPNLVAPIAFNMGE